MALHAGRGGSADGKQELSSEQRDLLILEELRYSKNISQRSLASRVGLAVGALNRHLHRLIEAGYVEVPDRAVRPFAYKLTYQGKRYCRELTHEYFRRVLGGVRAMERRIGSALGDVKGAGARRVVFYGAGEVMEVAFRLARTTGLTVVGVVDDDASKHGKVKAGLVVKAPSDIARLAPDAVVITTFRHAPEITSRIALGLRSAVMVWEL